MKKKFNFSIKGLIIINSLIISSFVQFGFFGFNIDYFSYYNAPNQYWNKFEFIAGYISTLTINEIFIAPFFVCSVLSLGFGYFLIKLPPLFLKINHNKFFTIMIIHVLFVLSWPMFIGYTNAFRQAVCLGFIFFLLGCLLEKKKNTWIIFFFFFFFFFFFLEKKKNTWLILFFFFLVLFSHKFGKYYIPIFIISIFLSRLKFLANVNYRLIYLINILLILAFFLPLKYLGVLDYSDNYVTGFDLLNFLYILFFFCFIILTLVKSPSYNEMLLSLIFIGSVTSSLVFLENSILYERINWLPFIFSIFIVSNFFSFILKIKYRIVILLILFSSMSLTLKIHWTDNINFFYNKESN